jgi:protein-S-isoprenylcysteine O-methyltransferase Ste14
VRGIVCIVLTRMSVAMLSLELKVPPVALVAAFAAVMWGVSVALPQFTVALPGASAVAAAFVGFGVALVIAGVITLKRQRTTINPLWPNTSASLVSTGVYRLSRNPMYLGFLLCLAGLVIYLSNAGSVALLPAFVAYMNTFQIKPEERALHLKFGPAFTEYVARVRRWV